MRGKLWSIEDERQLRELVSLGLGFTEISQVMGKPILCVEGKVYNLGLSVVVAAVSEHTVAATAAAATSPAPVTHGFGFLVEKNSSCMHAHTHMAAFSAWSHVPRVVETAHATPRQKQKNNLVNRRTHIKRETTEKQICQLLEWEF